MFETQVERAGIRLRAQSLGAGDAATVLLLAGNGCSAVYWPDAFCGRIVEAGFRVVRFDYRDTGASTRRAFEQHPYDLDDLADDVRSIIDALQLNRVHLVGLSMGGFLAQRIALDSPQKVASLTSMLSTSDYGVMLHTFYGGEAPASGLPAPSAEWLAALWRIPPGLSPTELLIESWRLANGQRAPFDRNYWKELVESAAALGDDLPAGEAHRQACLRSPRKNLLGELRRLTVPALFIGGTGDPIFPPGHAEASAAAAPGGRALSVEGLGHALNPEFFPRLTSAIIEHARGHGSPSA